MSSDFWVALRCLTLLGLLDWLDQDRDFRHMYIVSIVREYVFYVFQNPKRDFFTFFWSVVSKQETKNTILRICRPIGLYTVERCCMVFSWRMGSSGTTWYWMKTVGFCSCGAARTTRRTRNCLFTVSCTVQSIVSVTRDLERCCAPDQMPQNTLLLVHITGRPSFSILFLIVCCCSRPPGH